MTWLSNSVYCLPWCVSLFCHTWTVAPCIRKTVTETALKTELIVGIPAMNEQVRYSILLDILKINACKNVKNKCMEELEFMWNILTDTIFYVFRPFNLFSYLFWWASETCTVRLFTASGLARVSDLQKLKWGALSNCVGWCGIEISK